MTGLHGPDPLLATAAEAIGHRLPWRGEIESCGERVDMRTVIIEVLRVADGMHLLRTNRDEDATPDPVDVDEAARLLATGSPRYDDIPRGLGWRAVLHPANLQHAYRACMADAASQPERDRYSAAYALLRRHLAEAERRAASTASTQTATVSKTTTT